MATSSAMSTTNKYIKYTISVTQNSQSIDNNISNVTVKVRFYRTNTGYTTYGSGTVYCKINGTKYSASVTSSQKITNSGIELFTKTLNIKHDSDGTKDLTCSAWISHSQVDSDEQSYKQTLTTIPRKSTLSVANGTLGTSQTLTVTRKASSLTHTIKYTCGSASGTICTKSSSTSITFTPPKSLASQNTTGTTVSIKYTITTYSGDTNIGSNSYTKTCTISDDAVPSVSFTVSDYKGYKDVYGSYVQNRSIPSLSLSCSGSYSSTIKERTVTCDGSTYSSSSNTIRLNTIKSFGSIKITVKVTDSRGRSASASSTITAISYDNPKITSLSVRRCDSDGTLNSSGEYAKITFSSDVKPLNNKNSATYTMRYKKTSATTYTDTGLDSYNGTYVVSNGSKIISASSDSSYNIEVIVSDEFERTTRKTTVSTAFVLMHWRPNGTGMAIGKLAELDNWFDVGISSYFRGYVRAKNNLTVGEKEGYLDGKVGTYIDKDGYIQIQRSTSQGYVPYIGFVIDDSTEINGMIALTEAKIMRFSNASGFQFTNKIELTDNGNSYLGAINAKCLAGLTLDSSSFMSLLRQKTSSGHSVVLGGISDVWGFYGYYSGRTENGYDWYFRFDASTGDCVHTGNFKANSSLSTDGRIRTKGTYDTTTTYEPNMYIHSTYWTARHTSSSKRYKHDISDIGDELNPEKLLSTPIRQYKYNQDYLGEEDSRYNKDIPGFIAEELFEHYPIAVEIVDGKIEDWNQKIMIPPMLELIQRLWKKVEVLESWKNQSV